MSAFCGEYFNSTHIDKHGVIGNECYLNGLSFVPNILFVLIAVPVLISWNKSIFATMHVKTWVRFPHHIVRWLLFLTLIIINLFEVVAGFLSDEMLGGRHLHLFIPHIVSVTGTLVAVIYYHSVEMWNSPRFLLLLVPYWSSLAVIEVLKTINLNLNNAPSGSMRPHFTRASIALYLLLLAIELDLLRQLRYAFFKKRRMLKPPEYLADTNYVQSAVSLPSKATYFWIRGIVNQAVKAPLDLKDLGSLPRSEKSAYNYGLLLSAIEEERDHQKMNEEVNTSLCKSCWIKSQSPMVLAGMFLLVGAALHLCTPMLLVLLLDYVDNSTNAQPVNSTMLPKQGRMVGAYEFFTNGYVVSIIMLLCCLLTSVFTQAGHYLVTREGVRIRGALQMVMYGKMLVLSLWNFATKTLSLGEVVDHMSSDANNILFCFCVIHFIWLLPLKTLASLILLYYRVGLSAMAGFLAVLFLTCLQCILARQLFASQKFTLKLANSRVRKCTEVLKNIKCLKLYAWERVAAGQVREARMKQLKAMLKTCFIKALMNFISEAGFLMVMMFAFTIHPYIGEQPLTPQKIFPSILLFDILSTPIHLAPIFTGFLGDAYDSITKIAEFLTSFEIDSKRHKTNFQKENSFHENCKQIGMKSSMVEDEEVTGGNDDATPPSSRYADDNGADDNDGDHKHKQKVKMTIGDGEDDTVGDCSKQQKRSSNTHNDSSCKDESSKSNSNNTKEEIQMKHLSAESRRTENARLLSDELNVISEGDHKQLPHSPSHHAKVKQKAKKNSITTGKSTKMKKNKKIKKHSGKSNKDKISPPKNVTRTNSNEAESHIPGNNLITEQIPEENESESAEVVVCTKGTLYNAKKARMLAVPSVGAEMDIHARQGFRSSHSRRASQQDMTAMMMMCDKRSVLSASNSFGSGLDDDDSVDSKRDVGVAVTIHEGSYAWEPASNEAFFTNVKFKADAGKLTVIIGSAGSGKSSLISAMLGEMNRIEGTVNWKPSLTTCYAGGVPWLMNASVQENILFGTAMEKKRYRRVLKACALQQDIDILPDKDLTEIGEKGISLSQGQKLRVSIARAIYSKADLVVLDDPFSALDLPTASHIFEDGILHFCMVKRKRTIILVTHELHFLPFAHAIYQVGNGRVESHGKLTDVKEKNPQLFAVWQEGLRKARRENILRAEREDTTNTERLVLMRKIRTLEYKRDFSKSLLGGDRKGNSPKRVFISGQTTHITIEEEHPGMEDVQVTSKKVGDGLDNDDVMNLDQGALEGGSRNKKESKTMMLRKKRQQQQQQLLLDDLNNRTVSGAKRGPKMSIVGLFPPVRISFAALLQYARAACLPLVIVLLAGHLARVFFVMSTDWWLAQWSQNVSDTLILVEKDFQNNVSGWKGGRRRVFVHPLDDDVHRSQRTDSTRDAHDGNPDNDTADEIFNKPVGSEKSRQLFHLENSNLTARAHLFDSPYIHFANTYVLLCLVAVLLSLIVSILTEVASIRASCLMYFKMLDRVVEAPMRFFDSNPISKIMSRFSGDISVIDDKLVTTLEQLMRTLFVLAACVVINSYVSLYFLVPGAIILLVFTIYQYRFRLAYRELHKLDSLTSAPFMTHCSETLSGLRTIRAFKYERKFWDLMEKLVNDNNSTHLWLSTACRWAGIRLEFLASLMVMMSCMVHISIGVSSSYVGLGVTYALLTCNYVNWMVRCIADADVQVAAIQRIHEYCHLPSENDKKIAIKDSDEEDEPPTISDDWPREGDLIFFNVTIKYSGLDLAVARNVNIHIRPGEKVGICGKPGSGKSSLILSLFGLVDLTEGSIYMDGCKINNIPPCLLRSRLSVLPQDCMLLSGTVRFNLDAECKHTDDEVWDALEQVDLKETIKNMDRQLEAVVDENGDNFGTSEKQLLCLARAILKKSKFIIIDEVMSVLNKTTEMILCRVLRTAFNDRTVINLSHRPASLMNYDTVIVLENGKVVEHDTPQNLAQVEGGFFAALLKRKPGF